MKTFIILIPISGNLGARKHCEYIENYNFNITDSNCETVKAFHVKVKVIKLIDDNTCDLSGIEVMLITDFMDRVNDEEFNSDDYFISYVNA